MYVNVSLPAEERVLKGKASEPVYEGKLVCNVAWNSGKPGNVFCHVSSPLRALHWLPISLGVNAQILSKCYKIRLEARTPPTSSTPIPVSLSSGHNCLPKVHQVHAHLRVCSFDAFYTSLSSYQFCFPLQFLLPLDTLFSYLCFVYMSTLTMKAEAFSILLTVIFPAPQIV